LKPGSGLFRKIGVILSAAVWIVMMGSLYQREIRPALEAAQAPTYADYFRRGMAERTRMAIYQGQNKIGFSETSVNQIGEAAAQITNETQVDWILMGRRIPLRFLLNLNLDGQYNFEDFSLTLASGLGNAKMNGIFQGEKLHYTFEGLGIEEEGELDFDPRQLLVSSLNPFNPTGKLWVGKSWNVKMLNPIAGKMENARMTVTDETKMVYDGRTIDVYKVTMDLPGSHAESYSLIDQNGQIMEQKTPLGWRLVREPMGENADD
jgi:hypothetical protein